MNILAIDTTTKKADVCVKKSDNTLISKKIDNEITHSEKLLPLIDEILETANLKLSEIDNFCILNGPGSFTGIRISIATLKAFAQVLNKEIFSISSMMAIAILNFLNLQKTFTDNLPKYFVSLIDARNKRIYYQIFKISLIDEKILCEAQTVIFNEIIDTAISNIQSYFENLDLDYTDCYFSGNCITKFEEILNNSNISNILDIYPTTTDLITIYDNLYDTKDYTFNAFNLKAIYARPSQAERMKNER